MTRSTAAQWIIAIGTFFSMAPYGFTLGIPLYIVGLIMFWTTKKHIIDKISWTVLPIIICIVLMTIIYSA